MKPRSTLYILNPEVIPLLGKLKDSELAKRYNVCEATIGNLRRHRGIPSINAQAICTPEIRAALGKMTDSKVAKMFDLCETTVKRWRKQRKIKAKMTR